MALIRRILYYLCVTVVAAISLVLTLGILGAMVFLLSGSPTQTPEASPVAPIADKFDMRMTNALSGALEGILTVDPVYWLSDRDLTAPEPDAANSGTATDPAQLQWLLDEAADMLYLEDPLFSAQTPVKPDTQITYYLDKTIFCVTWKQVIGGGVYTFSEVKIAHPSQLRRSLSGGKYNSGILYTTTEMARSVNAVTAISGDYHSHRPMGVVVDQGQVYRAQGEQLDTCYIDDNGDMLFTTAGQITGEADAKAFVEEHNVRFSLSFGPVMLREGQLQVPDQYATGEINKDFARAALCQLGRLHYLLVTVNIENYAYTMPTMKEFAAELQALGVPTAYALDGGQTASLVTMDQLINSVSYGSERRISDILYFATAVPDGG